MRSVPTRRQSRADKDEYTGGMRPILVLATALFLAPAIASADALPECGPGERLETNPVEPGAMHHAGGQCVRDASEEPASGCSVARATRAPSFAAWFLVLAGAALVTRRSATSRVKSR